MLNWLSEWFLQLEWSRLIPELVGKGLGFILGFAASWYFLFRKRIKELQRFQQGDSDDILFQAHYLLPLTADRVQLLFRNVTTKLTVNQLYDNPAARELIRALAEQSTLNDPILPTHGTLGFELLNDAGNYAAGALANSPHAKKIWLLCMTCEDRIAVRRRCIRCFLVRAQDLERFENWDWVRSHVLVEKPWHWFRLIALHRIARVWKAERTRFARIESDQALPLVDNQLEHRRIIKLSLGLPESEVAAILRRGQAWFSVFRCSSRGTLGRESRALRPHEVVFEGCLRTDQGVRYPLCLEGERACPPEDVGGVYGYAEFLAAIADASHAEHKAWMAWAGGDFDPNRFDATAATKDMQRGLPDWRKLERQQEPLACP